jgi:CelD/BcsL family acetyltransferase involved in cellulose biosynthesis
MTNNQSSYFDIVAVSDWKEKAIRALFRHLQLDQGWDTMELTHLPVSGGTAQIIELMARSLRMFTWREWQMSSPYLVVEGLWDEYFVKRPKKFRDNVVYCERRLGRKGLLALEEITSDSHLVDHLERAFQIERATWKGQLGSAIICSQQLTKLYSGLATTFAATGNFRLYFLKLNDEVIAFDYCLVHQNTLSLVKIGYVPELAALSPGSVIRKKVLEHLFREGKVSKYDMLGRSDDWKMKWTDTVAHLEKVFVFRNRLTPTLMYLTRFKLRSVAKKMLFRDRQG